MTRSEAPPQSSRHLRLISILFCIAVGAAVLYRSPPTASSIYPQCPIWLLLGVQCPGCGATRALSALLHGHLREALRLNALTTLAIPLSILYAGGRRLFRIPAPGAQNSRALLYAGFAVLLAFTVARNL